MPFSRLPELIDRTLAAVRVQVDGTAAVWDGPVVSGDYRRAVYIGYDANPDGDFTVGDASVEWAGIGAKRRDETIQIRCAAHGLYGDANPKAARDDLFALLDMVSAAIHPLPALGAEAPTWGLITEFQFLTEPHERVGLEARAPFVITFRTRP